MEKIKIEYIKIADIVPYKNNPRKSPKETFK